MKKRPPWTTTISPIESVEKIDVSTVSKTIYKIEPRFPYKLHVD
jgi:hypothetical protein